MSFKIILFFFLATLQINSGTSQLERHDTVYGELVAEVKTGNRAATDCTPMLNFPVNFNASQRGEDSEFKFKIANLKMPLSNIASVRESSIGIAMKLLGQLDGEDSEDGRSDEDETNVIKFEDNELIVKGFNFSMFSIHLYANSDPRCSLGINVKNTTVTGKFSYNGPLSLNDISFVGYYRMQISDVYMTASTNLTKQLEENHVSNEGTTVYQILRPRQDARTPTQYYSLATFNLKMNITNLGYISIDIFDSPDYSTPSTNNYILRILKRVMQRTIKKIYYTFESNIRQAMEFESKKSIDCELSRYSPLLEPNSSYLDDLAKIVNKEIAKSNLSTVKLPNYEHQQTIIGTNAQIYFTNGSLSGLNNMKLIGDTRIKLQDQHLLVNSSIGWYELHSVFDWSLFIASNKEPSTKGQVSIHIKEFDFDTVITKGIVPNSHIAVEQLIIKKLDGIKMDLSGLPGLNRVTRGVVNFFMRNFKQRLASSIQPVIQQQLEKSLNELDMFI